MRSAYSPSVQVEMTDEDIIQRIRLIFGNTGSFLAITPRKSNWKPSYRWVVNGADAYLVMKLILPFMGERRTAKITECMSKYDSKPELRDADVHANIERAAREYVAGNGTHQSLAVKYGTSRESVRRKIKELNL